MSLPRWGRWRKVAEPQTREGSASLRGADVGMQLSALANLPVADNVVPAMWTTWLALIASARVAGTLTGGWQSCYAAP